MGFLSGIGSGLVGTVTGFLGDPNGAKAGQSAVNAQTNAATQANQLAREMYDTSRSDLAPWRAAGASALSQLQAQLPELGRSFTADDFTKDPGYQFRLDEANKALERSAAARGGLGSGATLKALDRYSQDYASNEYQNAYNRFNNDRDRKFNQLSAISGVGQTTSSELANQATNLGQTIGQNMIGVGNAQAANATAQGNFNRGLFGQAAGAGLGALFSDRRLKNEIQPISKAELAEIRDSVLPYFFKYKDQKHGKGLHIGVMAQELERTKFGRSLIITDEKGRKQIDVNKLLSLFLSTLTLEEKHAG